MLPLSYSLLLFGISFLHSSSTLVPVVDSGNTGTIWRRRPSPLSYDTSLFWYLVSPFFLQHAYTPWCRWAHVVAFWALSWSTCRDEESRFCHFVVLLAVSVCLVINNRFMSFWSVDIVRGKLFRRGVHIAYVRPLKPLLFCFCLMFAFSRSFLSQPTTTTTGNPKQPKRGCGDNDGNEQWCES